jgi:hypothetical protein
MATSALQTPDVEQPVSGRSRGAVSGVTGFGVIEGNGRVSGTR